MDSALKQAFRLIGAVEELSESLPKIESKEFGYPLVMHFQELGSVARELYFYHRKAFHDNEAWNKWNDVDKKLPKEDAQIVVVYLYGRMSDYIHYTELLAPLGEALKKYAKTSTGKISPKLNTFKLGSLKSDDAFYDYDDDYGQVTSREYGCFELFTDNKVIYDGKKTFYLEPEQWKLLHIFLEHANKLLGIDFITTLNTNVLDTSGVIDVESRKKYISKLRKTLEAETDKKWISVTRGKGWTFNLTG